MIGSGKEDLQETRILSRIIRVGAGGFEYEADQILADLIVQGLKLEAAS